jgi:predicted nucleotidyltransferase
MPDEILKSLIVKTIVSVLPEVEVIYLFGSRAQGTANEKSDFDIAILLPAKYNYSELSIFTLQQELSVAVNADVDLILLNEASLVLKFQIVQSGIILFSKNEEVSAKFEMTVLSMYQRFNEERKEILDEIKTSGKVYSK